MSYFDEWLKTLPPSQRRAIAAHLAWLDGRMPSDRRKLDALNFGQAPIASFLQSRSNVKYRRRPKDREGVCL